MLPAIACQQGNKLNEICFKYLTDQTHIDVVESDQLSLLLPLQ